MDHLGFQLGPTNSMRDIVCLLGTYSALLQLATRKSCVKQLCKDVSSVFLNLIL